MAAFAPVPRAGLEESEPLGAVGSDTAPVLPPRPTRQLDVVSVEELEEFVDLDSRDRLLLKSRDFPELQDLDVTSANVEVVLFDAYSVDSFAACFAARTALGERARYVGVTRGKSLEDLAEVDVTGKVVAMVGLCWALEAMHDLVAECAWLFILETHNSVAQEMRDFNYPSAVWILDLGMGAGALGWNFFLPGCPVPPLIRALEDAELGRSAFRHAAEFARGFEELEAISVPRDELLSDDQAFDEFEVLLDSGGRATMTKAIQAGLALAPAIARECQEAATRREVRTMCLFPAWKCALVEMSSKQNGCVAEDLARRLAADCGQVAGSRCFGAVYERVGFGIRIVLRSLPGGPDVSEIAALQDGAGRTTRAFFYIPLREWAALWVQPEPIFWEVPAAAPHCLQLKTGDLVTVISRGERFKDSPADEWSWGYKSDHPLCEGWIPTLSHTLFVAVRGTPSAGEGVLPVEEGDFIIAKSQRGDFVWGSGFQTGCESDMRRGWYRRGDGILQPIHAAGARALLATITAASTAAA